MAELSVDEIIESVSRSMSRRSYRERLDYMRTHEISRFLYKFRPAPTDARSIRPIRDIIVNSALWLGSPEGFNDPFDAKAKLIVDSTSEERRKRFNEIFKREGMPFHERERQVPRLVAKPIRELEKVASTKFQENMYETGVVSFAGNPLSILMWSHYGSDHRGVCFQFDVAKDPERFFFTLPVKYSDDYPVINWITDFGDFFKKTLLQKHFGWSYEGERRIIKLETTRQPYPFSPEALTAVIIGCHANPEPILALVEERVANGLPRPRLYRAA
jgi:hypothetical protein